MRLALGRLIPGLLLLTAALLAIQTETSAVQLGDPVAAARLHLSRNAGALGLSPGLGDLHAVAVREGLSGQHVRFQQTLGGVPVFGAFVTVNLPPGGVSRQPGVVSRYRPGATAAPAPAAITPGEAAARATAILSPARADPRAQISAEPVYFEEGGGFVRAWQLLVPTLDPPATWLLVLSADGARVLLRQNVLRFDGGRVFNPNPPTTSGGTIPPPSQCDNAAEATALAGQYATLPLQGILDGQNKLTGEFVDLTAPGISGYKPAGQANEASRNYIYACNDDRFEEVMVYRHLDAVQRKIQALGFAGDRGILDHAIPAHAHYYSGCNAFYDPVDRGLHFGDSNAGGCSPDTDAAEDGDVIVHEYGHAIQDNQVPAWGFGAPLAVEQAAAMGEGFGDFLAAAVFADPCIGEWFSVGQTDCAGSPGLRTLDNTNHYPEDFEACRPAGPPGQPAEPHCAGLIWGGALWDLVEGLGNDQAARDLALTLVLDSHFYLDPQATFAEAAAAIRLVDEILYQGGHTSVIDSVFAARGISDLGAVSDFPYAYLRVLHTFRGDLEINLKVGSISTPSCSIDVWNPDPSDGSNDLVGYEDLSVICTSYLPPTPAQPWYLEARDTVQTDVGIIEEFEIVLPGAQRCIASDTPVSIPDMDGFVYSMVDCSLVRGAYPAGDLDGDGFSGELEGHVGTGPLDSCGFDGWPADLDGDNALAIGDFNGFTFPLRPDGSFSKFGHTVPDVDDPNLARWDLDGDAGIMVGDLNALNPAVAAPTARPPMLGGVPAFSRSCPFPP